MSNVVAPARIIDISVPVFPGMPIFPGDPEVSFTPSHAIDDGDLANITHIQIGSHTGTHFDAPHHILNDGRTLDSIPLEHFYGPVQVVVIPDTVQAITAEVLSRVLDGPVKAPRLLLKTRNSAFWQTHPTTFREDFAALTADGAQCLVDAGVQLVGIDYLSIELFENEGLPAHKILMRANVLILESVNLTGVAPGLYTLSAFPVAYQKLDGGPARVVLLET